MKAEQINAIVSRVWCGCTRGVTRAVRTMIAPGCFRSTDPTDGQLGGDVVQAYEVGERVKLVDASYCGDGWGYVQAVSENPDRPYKVTNQQPGTDDRFVWGAWVSADEIELEDGWVQ